jgi:hypothetical protein
MTIKYGEFTIIYKKEQTIIQNLLNWLKYEDKLSNSSKYIFLFDDGEICEYGDKNEDFHFKFFNSVFHKIPLHFQKNTNNNIYFYKKPIDEKNYNCFLDFNELFSLYSKYDFSVNIESDYNCIYYCNRNSLKLEIFGIIRIKSNEYMPRFQFAYDSNEFTKEEIIYLIHYIFTK